MNVNEALEHANSFFIADFIYAAGDGAMRSERMKNEEAIQQLVAAYFEQENPPFSFDIVLELADRNRDLCDNLGVAYNGDRGLNLPRGLSDETTITGIAAMQGNTVKRVAKKLQGIDAVGQGYRLAPMGGTVIGIDIETTSRNPDRGYIIDVGWETMEIAEGQTPVDPHTARCGLPALYEQVGVPLSEVHGITWPDVADKKPFREDKELQAQVLAALESHPYMAHNAAFEDAWFLLNLPGYAEGRKAGRIIPVDTREICRAIDTDAASISFKQRPYALESWARRRGTLAADENERHLGLDDTELMMRTVVAELSRAALLK